MSRSKGITLYELVLFPILGVLMFVSKLMMEFLPNIHLLGMFIMVFTITFRSKALIPIYIYVLLEGVVYGFGMWWMSYLYVWAILWAITMLLPRRMPHSVAGVVYPVICSLHGLAFGALCAPVQAIMLKFTIGQMLTWIAMGFPFDVTHAIGNFCFGLLILPLTLVIARLRKNSRLA